MKCEMLIMQLYPWLSITETSTNTVSGTLNVQPQAKPKVPTADAPKVPEENTVKKGFFAKLFGKK